MQNSGTPDAACDPYTAIDPQHGSTCGTGRCSDYLSRTFYITGWSWIATDAATIKNDLYTHGPVIVWMPVYSDFPWWDASYWQTYYYSHSTSGSYTGHFVVIVGWYGSSYWIVRNSWGTGGGDVNDGYGGYFYMTQDPTTGFFGIYQEAAVISGVSAPSPFVSTDKTTYAWLESILFTGTGFTPGGSISSCISTGNVAGVGLCVGQPNANSQGNVAGSMAVGTNIPPGPQKFWVADISTGRDSNAVQLTILPLTYVLHVQSSPITGVPIMLGDPPVPFKDTNFDITSTNPFYSGPFTAASSVTEGSSTYLFDHWEVDGANMGPNPLSRVEVGSSGYPSERTAVAIYGLLVTKTATSTVTSTLYSYTTITRTTTSYTSTSTLTSTIPTLTTVVLVPLTITSTERSTQFLNSVVTTTMTSYTSTTTLTSTVPTTIALVQSTVTSIVQSIQYLTSILSTTTTSYTSTETSTSTVVVPTTVVLLPTTTTSTVQSTQFLTSTLTTTTTSYTATTTSTSTSVVYTTVTTTPGGASAAVASSPLAYLALLSLFAIPVGRVTVGKGRRILRVRSLMERRCSRN